jgi:hypothetical protein
MKRFVLPSVLFLAAIAALMPSPRPVSAATGYQTESLMDPIFRMKAYDVTIPAGWQFQGIVSPGTPCKTEPFPVFRAYSPDGLSEFRRMPRMDWSVKSSAVLQRFAPQCPNLPKKMNADELLHYLSNVFGYTYVAAWPIAASETAKYQASITEVNGLYKSHNMPGYSMSGDFGAARTEIKNGSFTIEQQLAVAIICTVNPLPDGTATNDCTANIRALRAPKGHLDQLVQMMDGHSTGAAEDPQWRQAVNQAAAARTQDIMRQRDIAFRQWSDVMMHQHQQFMAQMASEGATRNTQFQAHIAAKDTATSDWVDYALDQQTVTGSGGTAKVSSAYTHTWSNGDGQWYQTNDPSANPNGVMSGNWTQQQVVHGNGTPY